MIRRTKHKPYYCAKCGEARSEDEVMKGSMLVAKRLVRRWLDRVDKKDRLADPLRCIYCHQKVRVKVFQCWRERRIRIKERSKCTV